VEVDRGQMEQVFMNLFVNAWQAMPGGGEIYLETENVDLDDARAISYSVRPGRYVKISVTDTGTGMDEKTRERIFDPFFTTKGMGRGTGLGLATVYGIIKGHKGAINVYSEPGHGTTFTIYLPASEREVIGEKTETWTIAMGTETILLVDDEKMVLEVSREMLEFLGYRVYAAGSGQEALAVYMEKRNEIDLVILDMIMPGISGGETFDRLREINSAVRVLLSSGYSINGEAKHILDRGCNGFIQKPFHLTKLSRKIREVLD
jgi:two-component system cell cycle sensor histidine kinase/response regulator CckA